MSLSTPQRIVDARDTSDDEGAGKRRWWQSRRPTSAERCAQAMEGGALRYVFEAECLEPCAFTSAALSENSVAYRIVGGGVDMCGTILLSAPEEGRFDATFGAGRLPASDAFGSFQELFAKLSAVFNAERLARRRGGRPPRV